MSIELRVRGRRQTSPMSCWWASMSMILEYYGTNYTYPWEYRRAFERPSNRPSSPLPDRIIPTIDQAMNHDSTLRRSNELMFARPYEWYFSGLPLNRRAIQMLAEITGFQGYKKLQP